jgi:predicted nucleic acid-binding protein
MAAERHVKLFKNGRQSGSLVNSSFLLIAAQTLALGYTIVTDNEKEFAPIKDLPRENWLRHN